MNQNHYSDRLELMDLSWFAGMSNDDTYDESGQPLVRSKAGALNWLAMQTAPGIAYKVMEVEVSTSFKKATVTQKLINLSRWL